jgi:hypothetical protein
MGRKFSSGSEAVRQVEDDFTAVCQVMAGRSRWQKFISPNIATAIKKYPGRTFSIDSALVFTQQNFDPITKGYTDKVKGEMKFLELFEHSAYTYMIFPLHEMVHWVSHPPEQGAKITVWGALGGDGLGEGLTQVVTEDILNDQNISLGQAGIYSERVAIVRKLIERFDVQPFGEALFGGRYQALKPVLDTYGLGFNQIRTLANANNSRKAIECIDNLNRAFNARQVKGAAIRTR